MGLNLKILEGWDVSYQVDRYWFHPDYEDDNSLIHYVRTTYYVNKDLYVKLFYQSKYGVRDGIPELSFDLLRETLQFVFVWRFLPPFGSLQLAYQEGTTQITQIEGSGRTLFVKLSWVF